ncbi:MAG: tryptophan-rich sensory protein TspO [Bacteroidetes bacterium HLUCCA01]|nr:MAG: tryptophan-rich sensory protein TspO [Bacteroidetes bacterium HLUCCA01]
MDKLKSTGIFVAFLLLPVLVGVTASMATATSVTTWYAGLEKPFFSPPNWLFGPVWTLLYVLMGVSSYLVFIRPASAERKIGLDVYGVTLVLNFAWSFLFFYFRSPGIALVDIVILWFFILGMIIQFYRVRPVAGLLQIPYLLWVTFATMLNGAVWWLN